MNVEPLKRFNRRLTPWAAGILWLCVIVDVVQSVVRRHLDLEEFAMLCALAGMFTCMWTRNATETRRERAELEKRGQPH